MLLALLGCSRTVGPSGHAHCDLGIVCLDVQGLDAETELWMMHSICGNGFEYIDPDIGRGDCPTRRALVTCTLEPGGPGELSFAEVLYDESDVCERDPELASYRSWCAQIGGTSVVHAACL